MADKLGVNEMHGGPSLSGLIGGNVNPEGINWDGVKWTAPFEACDAANWKGLCGTGADCLACTPEQRRKYQEEAKQ